MTNKNAVLIAKKYIDLIKTKGITVKYAYLFGSYAKGKPTIHSDIDICIISPTFTGYRQTNRVRLMNLRHTISDNIETHPLTPEEFNNQYDPFVREVKKGISLDQ